MGSVFTASFEAHGRQSVQFRKLKIVEEITLKLGQIVKVNGKTYYVPELDDERIHLRRVTCQYFPDGRVKQFVQGSKPPPHWLPNS